MARPALPALPAQLPALARWLALAASVLATAVPARAATLRGTASDPGGQRVADAEVRVTTGSRDLTTRTGRDGTFSFEGLPAGAYRVRVLLDGFRAEPRDVTLGAEDEAVVDVRLEISAVTEAIVVSGAQVETTLSNAPSSTTVIAAADLERHQIDTLSDALRTVPGLSVAVSGSRGALTSVFPRGGESDYTLVMVDGARVNLVGGGYDFATLTGGDVDRIEVVRGPQSALFGADAIGGVVQVVSRTGGPFRLGLTAEGGSHQTGHAAASTGGSAGAWTWSAAADHLRSEGWNGERTADDALIGNDDFRRSSGGGTLAVTASPVTARLAVSAGASERGFPGPFGSDPNGTYPGLDLVSRGRNQWASAAGSATFGISRTQLRLSGAWADLQSRFDSPYGRSDTGTRRSSARAQIDAPLTRAVSLSAGTELIGERATSTFITGEALQPIPVTRDDAGAFAELRVEAVDRLLVTAGLRIDWLRRDRLAPSPNPWSPRPELPDDTVVSPNPRVAASWFAQDPAGHHGWTRLHGSIGTGIRAPDALEIAFTDNAGLEPERSRSVDLGVEQAWLDGALIVDVTAFHNRYDQLIVAVGRSFADASQYLTDNIANARARGLETSAALRARGGLSLSAAYTWLDTAVLAVDGASGEAPPPFEAGDPLIRRPRHQGWVGAVLARPRWSAFTRVDLRGSVQDVDPTYGAFGGTITADGYVVLRAGGSLDIGRRLHLLLRAENLLDARYEEAAGYPALGRSIMLGARVAAGR
jgi:outer membrane cobalamin receptor